MVPFAQNFERAMDIEVAANGDLLYVDQTAEAVQRIAWTGDGSNDPPTAVAQADTVSGNRPLTVTFSSEASSDPDPGDVLVYEWDLDGDGELDDSTEESPVHTYLQAGAFTVTLRVTDASGAADTDTLTIEVGDGPVASIDTPAAGTTWQTGDLISFSGSAADETRPRLDWVVALVHCPTAGDCHEEELANVQGRGRWSFTAPDHGYPSYIEIRLTATASGGETQTTTRRLDPRTASLTVDATPPGAKVLFDGAEEAAPVTKQAIVGSTPFAVGPRTGGDRQHHPPVLLVVGRAVTEPYGHRPRRRSASRRRASCRSRGQPDARPRRGGRTGKKGIPTSNFGTSTSCAPTTAPGEQSYLRFLVGGRRKGDERQAAPPLRPTATSTAPNPAARAPRTENRTTWQNTPPATPG